MSSSFIDLFNHIIQYNKKTVYIAFHDKTFQPYFNANHVCDMLGYTNHKLTLKINVPKEYMMKLSDVDKNYKRLYKNVQGTTKFLNEAGLYKLIFSSRKKNASEIVDWFTGQVIPSIRKYGEYKLSDELKTEIDQINDKFHNLKKELKEKEDEISVLQHNMKSRKYPVGDTVYLLRTFEVSLDLDQNEVIDIKIGSTKNPNKRKSVLDTTVKNKTQILKIIKVNNAKNIESCVLAKMEHALSKIKKDYIHSSYNEVMKYIAKCVRFYEDVQIDIEPELDVPIRIMSRTSDTPKLVDFDRNKIYRINFVSENNETSNGSDEIEYQNGGSSQRNTLEYIGSKMNYLRLCSYMGFLKKYPDIESLTKNTQNKNKKYRSNQELTCVNHDTSKEIDNLSY